MSKATGNSDSQNVLETTENTSTQEIEVRSGSTKYIMVTMAAYLAINISKQD